MKELNINETLEISGGARTSTILLSCAGIVSCFAGPVGIAIGIGLNIYAIAADDE